MTIKKGTVLLVAFYNIKALGVRYLEASLEKHGYEVTTVFYKDFNSRSPSRTTQEEIELLCRKIAQVQPLLIGFSVMSSMYLETVDMVIKAVTSEFALATVCGGAYASMFPDHFLNQGIDFVIRADGEYPLVLLADAISRRTDVTDIPSLCYRTGSGITVNAVGDTRVNIDDYGIPAIWSRKSCFIDRNKLAEGDPQLTNRSYEIIASRGCPFTCSYCCCMNLRRLYPKDIPPVRTRSVKCVIDELLYAKRMLKHLVFVHFYDEVFPNSPEWIDEFVAEYRNRIHLPFSIWCHPKLVRGGILKKLVAAGLTEVIMGVQSGSPRIRREVFHRYESQNDIFGAVTNIRESGVPWAVYDFMLQHPFETIETLKETYALVEKIDRNFELQLHGLNFLPGTDIIRMTVEKGYRSEEEMEKLMYAPMQRQFDMYWASDTDVESLLWYKLIYCLQFPGLRQRIGVFAGDPIKHQEKINHTYSVATKWFRLRRLHKKAHIMLTSKIAMLT